MQKPYAESCDQNRQPIAEVLERLLPMPARVLEIGSGTGQHAVYFARRMPHLTWVSSDRGIHHPGIMLWLDEAALPNTLGPLRLDVLEDAWPAGPFDAVFSANTAHIMHWEAVEALFSGVGAVLRQRGLFLLYGPFNYNHRYTSESNARFDGWLKAQDPLSGIRNFEDLDRLADDAGMELHGDFEMPANNRTLCWRKR